MSLTGSGQISFNDVRAEMSQSATPNYALGGWTWGYNYGWTTASIYPTVYAPINVLSSGSRFSEGSPLLYNNLSMSAWYGYNHTSSINTRVTGTLYEHADLGGCELENSTTMLITNMGTSNDTYSINISGSPAGAGNIEVYYGKPWKNDGTAGTSSLSTYITGGYINGYWSFDYNYTYDSNKGQYIYFILFGACG